jgi:hypothetical protein
MKKEEWEKFWEFLIFKADKRDEWWLSYWLEWKKEEFENVDRFK